MRVDLTQSITAEQTRNEQVRQGAKLADKGTIRALLEALADDTQPIIVEIYGVKKDKQPNDYFLRECRSLLIYEGAAFKEREEIRREEEGKAAAQVKRTARLDQIKAKLRAERKADNDSFDKKYDAQSEERVEIAEAEIERAALAILKKEEETIK